MENGRIYSRNARQNVERARKTMVESYKNWPIRQIASMQNDVEKEALNHIYNFMHL